MVVSDAAISSSSEHLKKIPNIRTLPLLSNNWYIYVFILFMATLKAKNSKYLLQKRQGGIQ